MRKKAVRLTCTFIVLILALGVVSYLRLLDAYELILLDLRFKARPKQEVNPRIVIVEIADDTLDNLGVWPLPRDYHAALIKVLSESGVKEIIFDVFFSEPTETDELLAEASRRADSVYYPFALQLEEEKGGFHQASEYKVGLLPALAKAAKGTGHANVLTDVDGKRRRVPLFISYRGGLLPQLSLKAACDYLQISPEEIKIVPRRFVQLGEVCRIPLDEEAAMLINLAGVWKDTFEHYSYYDILAAYAKKAEGGSLPPLLAQLKDKVCFVGITATGTTDINPSALEPRYPIVGLHVNLFNSIVTENFLRRLPRSLNLGVLYLLCLATGFFTLRTKPLIGILFQSGLLVSFAGLGFLLFLLAGLWIDLFFPLAACLSVYLGTSLFRYVNELRERELLEKELSIARDIQRSFLKEVPSQMGGISVSVEMDTAHHVGGDLYDFVKFADGRIGLLVGDVSGKGVPAALFMAQVISLFRHFAPLCSGPSETLTKLNQEISRDAKSGLFVTMVYLIYTPATAEISFSSAGHFPPLIFRPPQPVEKIEFSEGMPLGLMAAAVFEEKRVKLNQGDTVLLYTDGVTEARDKRGREFGEEAIIQALGDKQEFSSQQTLQALKTAINAFVGRTPQHDDITIMALKAI